MVTRADCKARGLPHTAAGAEHCEDARAKQEHAIKVGMFLPTHSMSSWHGMLSEPQRLALTCP